MFRDLLVGVKNLPPAAVSLEEGYHSFAPMRSFIITYDLLSAPVTVYLEMQRAV